MVGGIRQARMIVRLARMQVEDAKSFVNAKFVPKMQDHPQVSRD